MTVGVLSLHIYTFKDKNEAYGVLKSESQVD
jgi:hypothetical protein